MSEGPDYYLAAADRSEADANALDERLARLGGKLSADDRVLISSAIGHARSNAHLLRAHARRLAARAS